LYSSEDPEMRVTPTKGAESSSTSVVRSRNVVIKLMTKREVSDREKAQRKGTSPKHVVPILYSSEDPEMREIWARELKKLGRWQKYTFGIVMPCAQRNLMVIFFQEKLTMSDIRQIFESLARSIAHLHAIGRIHGDIKPLNIVRAFDESIMLIDLDMAVNLREPVGAKQLSTAFVGPEATYETVDADGGAAAEFRKADAYPNGVAKLPLVAPAGANYGDGEGYAADGLLLAHPTFDLWSYAVVLYYAIAHKPLLETAGADQLRGKAERIKLARWSTADLTYAMNDLDHAMLMQGYDDQTRLVVCDLLAWLLQKDPKKRPQSCEEMLAHPFFATGVRSLDMLADGLHLSRLHVASALGNDSEVRSVLAQVDAGQASADEELGPGTLLHCHPLHLACAGGHVNVVKTLIARKDVDRNALDGAGRTALVVLQNILSDDVGGNDEFKANLEEVRALLAQKLTLAQSAAEVQQLIGSGEDPNVKDAAGNAPLHHHAPSLAASSIEVVRALLDSHQAQPNAQNKVGKTPLHLAQSTDMVRVLLAAGGDAFELADEDGRTAFESQTLTIREFLLNETLFCGRFEVPSFRPESPAKPEHATATSVVLRARDKFPGVDEDGRRHPRDVVLKLMKHKAQFDNETGQRQGLHVAFVIKVIYTSTDEGLASKWIKELPPEYADYPFGIVMPAAERNLMDVLLKERVDLALGKTMFASFARALGHLHDRGLIQGDFKPGNVVRMPDGTWILIDMDGAVRIGDPIGAKGLSTAFMPPEACHVQGDEVVFRVRREGAPYEVLEAHPTLDLWSFFVVLYRVVVHRPLLEADDRDNLRSKREEMTLATWGAQALSGGIEGWSLVHH